VSTDLFDLLKALHQPMYLNLAEEKKIVGEINEMIIPKRTGEIPSYMHDQARTNFISHS
jgi:hypothetical protein